MRERMERRGWWVFSSTMEEVPVDIDKLPSFASNKDAVLESSYRVL
jgi:hypothetical protein